MNTEDTSIVSSHHTPIYSLGRDESMIYQKGVIIMKTLEIKNANIFIIPNGLHKNEKKDLEVQCWITAEEDDAHHKCDNLFDHGVVFKDADETYVRPSSYHAYIPVWKFIDCKEGDVVTIEVPCAIGRRQYENNAVLRITATLNQRGYRYRHFGDFDEILAKLVEAYKKNAA